MYSGLILGTCMVLALQSVFAGCRQFGGIESEIQNSKNTSWCVGPFPPPLPGGGHSASRHASRRAASVCCRHDARLRRASFTFGSTFALVFVMCSGFVIWSADVDLAPLMTQQKTGAFLTMTLTVCHLYVYMAGAAFTPVQRTTSSDQQFNYFQHQE